VGKNTKTTKERGVEGCVFGEKVSLRWDVVNKTENSFTHKAARKKCPNCLKDFFAILDMQFMGRHKMCQGTAQKYF
jgi:hypothetical protein